MMNRDNVTVKKDILGYLPTINAPPTKLFTVYEVLNNVLKIKNALDIDEFVCVFDQALYAKTAEITWQHEDKYKKVVLRMGTFHTICNLISIKGIVLKFNHKLFGLMLLVASSRKLDMKDVLGHPLGPLPWSLANCDGIIKKDNEARKLDTNAHHMFLSRLYASSMGWYYAKSERIQFNT